MNVFFSNIESSIIIPRAKKITKRMDNDAALRILQNGNFDYIKILSIDPGYTSIGVSSFIYYPKFRKLSIDSIAILNVGDKKTSDDVIITRVTNFLNEHALGKYHCCFIEKQNGIAQSKVIRVEQHISTLLRYAYRIPVLIVNPRSRNKDKPKNIATFDWLIQTCAFILKFSASDHINSIFNMMAPKQKSDIGASVVQVYYAMRKYQLIA